MKVQVHRKQRHFRNNPRDHNKVEMEAEIRSDSLGGDDKKQEMEQETGRINPVGDDKNEEMGGLLTEKQVSCEGMMAAEKEEAAAKEEEEWFTLRFDDVPLFPRDLPYDDWHVGKNVKVVERKELSQYEVDTVYSLVPLIPILKIALGEVVWSELQGEYNSVMDRLKVTGFEEELYQRMMSAFKYRSYTKFVVHQRILSPAQGKAVFRIPTRMNVMPEMENLENRNYE